MSGNALLAGGGTSIPAMVSVPPPPQNPYAQVGQLAQTANALMGLQQNQMQLQARQALGQAYQDSTDPVTGIVDQNKLTGNVSQGPAAYMTGEIQQRNLANMKAQIDINAGGYDNAVRALNLSNLYIAP